MGSVDRLGRRRDQSARRVGGGLEGSCGEIRL